MYKNLILAALVTALALSIALGALAQGSTSTVEVRVWERIGDPEQNYISARPAGGSWSTLGTIPLDMDGESRSGTFRYGDITLDVPLPPLEPDLGPVSPRAGMVEITCTYYRSEWGDADPRNASWHIEGTFLHRLPRNYGSVPIHVGVQPKRPDDVPSNVDGQSWDERAFIVGGVQISDGRAYPPKLARGVQTRWSRGIGAGPYPGSYYVDFPKLYVVSYYIGDPIRTRVALDPAVECLRTEDVSE